VTAPAELITRFCAQHPAAVLWDPAGPTLRDVFSAKPLPLDPRSLRDAAWKTTPEGDPYLVLVREDERQLVLARQGIAFPPDLRNSGPLPGLPQVVCWRDFAQVAERIGHILEQHPEQAPGRELLDMVRYCIALLDGARAAGFDVGEEERHLDAQLEELERRMGTSPGRDE
jgi:hypothetical protein